MPSGTFTEKQCRQSLGADMAECWRELEKNGGSYCLAAQGTVKLHPAASRLDLLRRDRIKGFAALGWSRAARKVDDKRTAKEKDLEALLDSG